MLGQAFEVPSSSYTATQSGNIYHALMISSPSRTWIIDSRAIDHMTNDSTSIHTYFPCSGSKVKAVDGSFTLIGGKGKISIISSLMLSSLLHVPKILCNLLSISKINKFLNCFVTFIRNCFKFVGPNNREDDWQCWIERRLHYLEPKGTSIQVYHRGKC